MKAVDTRVLAQRLDRFLHWFFTTTPTADLDGWQAKVPKLPKVARRAEARPPKRVRALHAGPVRVKAAKGKP